MEDHHLIDVDEKRNLVWLGQALNLNPLQL
jgi:hypothetical protein